MFSKAQIEAMEKLTGTFLRLVGPRMSAADSLQDEVGIRHCPKCTPPPQTYTCPVCDTNFSAQWQLKCHYKFGADWCRQRGERKARAWSRKA